MGNPKMDAEFTAVERLFQVFRRRYGSQVENFRLPPPSFITMQGEILDFDEQAGILSARYPVLESELNPYGTMQGGFIAAAVDNTFGPLSFLVAPPSVTRRMEVTYSRPVTPGTGFIVVKARFTSQDGRQIELDADILDPQGARLARAHATNWIIADSP